MVDSPIPGPGRGRETSSESEEVRGEKTKKILSKVVLKADEKNIKFGTNIWQHSRKLKCDPTFPYLPGSRRHVTAEVEGRAAVCSHRQQECVV